MSNLSPINIAPRDGSYVRITRPNGGYVLAYWNRDAWHKRSKHGKSAFGTGYVLRSASEPYLIGTLGSPLTAKNVRNVIESSDLDVIDAVARGHSRKPDEQYDYCQRLAPRAVRFAELFGRQRWPGWDVWGNEADKFEAEAA